MIPAYTGSGPYCYSNSLHMCLALAGMPSVPAVALIECMTGMPFGASFLKVESPLFFPSPGAKTNPDRGLSRALDTLGWTCLEQRSEEPDAALAMLQDALDRGPALVGPLDMGWLSYDPLHAHKRGGDHFVVALRLDGDLVQLHDPQLYPFAVLPVGDLVRAWNAQGIGYATAPYTLRCDFRAVRGVPEDQMLADTLATAREMVSAVPAGPVAYGGALAFSQAAEALRRDPPEPFTGLLVHFALPLGARRCVDAAGFLHRMGRTDAARLMADKAQAFGQAQYHAAQRDWARTAALFEVLAGLETQVAPAI